MGKAVLEWVGDMGDSIWVRADGKAGWGLQECRLKAQKGDQRLFVK